MAEEPRMGDTMVSAEDVRLSFEDDVVWDDGEDGRRAI